jgi:hypothetical protein
MGDLIGFQGFLNQSAPINPKEYDYVWKYDRRYWDFQPGNEIENECPWEYPRFWDDDGTGLTTTPLGPSCRNSEFAQVRFSFLSILTMTDLYSMEKSPPLETTPSGKGRYPSSHLCRIVYADGGPTC